MTINNSTIYTSFKEGMVYINYTALPEDEDGDLVIPDDSKIYKYLKAYAIFKTLEDIWLKESFPGIEAQIAYFKDEASKTYFAAKSGIKMTNMTSGWDKRMKEKNQKQWTI